MRAALKLIFGWRGFSGELDSPLSDGKDFLGEREVGVFGRSSGTGEDRVTPFTGVGGGLRRGFLKRQW